MATHSSILAWRIPGTEEPGGLPSLGSHRGGQVEFFLVAKKLYVYNRKLVNKSRKIKTSSKVSTAYNVLIYLLLTLFQRIY